MTDRFGDSILRLKNVSLQATVGSDFLLQDISCDLQSGKKIGVIGASGSGKTSFLKLLNRLVSPTTGEIFFKNISSQQFSAIELRRSVVLTPQEPKLLGMKAIEALKYPLKLQHLSEAEIRVRVDTWIDLLRIPESWLNKTELQLSLGQRQLVTIARALAMQPDVLLLDEPTSALDIRTATRVLQVLAETNLSQDLTIVIVNHQLELIKDFCDRLLFFQNGKLEHNVKADRDNWQMLREKLMRSRAAQEEEWK